MVKVQYVFDTANSSKPASHRFDLANKIGVAISQYIRIPSARDKPAIDLHEDEKTLYYERMAFVIEIPSIREEIDGNSLSLVVGGVKSYSLDNLYVRKGYDEHFKVFIGFQNKVCTNMCNWSDGFQADIRVKESGQLAASIKHVLQSFNASYQLFHLKQLADYHISEQQFALIIGRCRMYPHLPKRLQAEIPPLRMGDSQINTIVNNYYNDRSFCRMENGEINLGGCTTFSPPPIKAPI